MHIRTTLVRIFTNIVKRLSEEALFTFAIEASRADTLFIFSTEDFIGTLTLVAVRTITDMANFANASVTAYCIPAFGSRNTVIRSKTLIKV